jgi:ribosome-interacting GTPase 1
MPGMLAYEDVNFQLIDLPPITADYIDSWYVNALQPADAALLVVDVTEPDCTETTAALLHRLEERRVSLVAEWPASAKQGPQADPPHADDGGTAEAVADPFRIRLPTLLVASKADRKFDSADLEALKELLGIPFASLAVSAETGGGVDAIGKFLFRELGVVRVYTKAPGKPPEMDRPFTVRHGATVQDVARLVHKEIAETLKYARAWGTGVYDGQQVGPEHRIEDKDVLELH